MSHAKFLQHFDSTMKTMIRKLISASLLALSLPAHALPRPDHIVVVIEENHGYEQIMGQENSYIRELASRGMLFSRSYGVTHPSEPNYLALFSGSTHNVTDDSCPQQLSGENLAATLIDNHLSFATYSEGLPAAADAVCSAGAYQRKHNPAANWSDLPAGVNLPFSDFPQDFSRLPTVSFVIPNQDNDMHDGSFIAADEWLKTHINPYLDWAYKHNSLLILTWDEDDFKGDNRVVTILAGPMVKKGTSGQRIDHYNVLRTLLDFYGLQAIGNSRDASPIKGIWR